MTKANRTQSEIQRLNTVITIKETKNGLEVDIDISGTDHVPVSLELVFRPGGVFAGLEEITPNQTYVLKGKEGKYSVDNQYYICINKTCLPPNEVLDDILALI
jgi:uncharacterized protein YyaL (SSP411 family)